MKAALLQAKGDIVIGDIPAPEITAREVLVKVRASGVCGSDIPRVLEGTSHYFPNVLGHEFSGEVVALGAEVSGLQLGDKVSVAPLKPCHTCDLCKEGNYALCGNYSFIGSREFGGWAEYVKAPVENIVPLGSTDYVAGAFVEPVSVALHGLYGMDIQPTDSVAIIGVGTIGLLTFQAVRAMGVEDITLFDVNRESLKKAETLGAKKTMLSTEAQGVGGFDHVLETAGATAAEKMALAIAGNKGSIMFIGTPKTPLTLEPKEFEQINRKELTLRGSWMSYSSPFPGKEWTQAVELLESGAIQVEPLIDRIISIEELPKAFEAIDKGEVSGKVLMTFSE